MAIELNAGSGGATLGTDTVAGTDYQIVKFGFSIAGAAPVQVSTTDPLPITGTVTANQGGVWSVGQSGAWTVGVNNFPATQAVTQSGVWTVQQGTPPWTMKPDGTLWTLTGTSANVNVTNSVAVTGTFWQATQPVSGPLTDVQLRASAVPVSLATAPTTSVRPDGTVWTITGTSANVNLTNALVAGTNRIGSVRLVDSADADLTTTKAVQTSRVVGVQNITDAGRTELTFYANGVAAGATGTETAITLTKSADTGATSSAASFVVTSGKRFRIKSITFATRGHATATAQVTTFNIRVNTAGAVTTASTPIILAARCATPATASAWDRNTILLERDIVGTGTLQFGVTANAVYVTNAPTWDVMINGYEY